MARLNPPHDELIVSNVATVNPHLSGTKIKQCMVECRRSTNVNIDRWSVVGS